MEVTVAQMKAIEQSADARGLRYPQMMEYAGQAAARFLQERLPVRRLAVFCGTGNNGGDGYVLARALHQAGAEVRIYPVGGLPRTADARTNYDRARELGIPVVEEPGAEELAFVAQADALVDAIYGTGFHGALRPEGRWACDQINRAGGRVLALDLPSGLGADTGLAAEGTVRADWTVTFHAAKPCHRLAPDYCGQTEVVSIGIEALDGLAAETEQAMTQIGLEAREVIVELVEAAKLGEGDLLVIGCSSSEMVGSRIGRNSSLAAAQAAFGGIYPILQQRGIRLAVQCCEHLNRALIVEEETAEKLGYEIVNVRPQPKAGGSFATTAWAAFSHPVAVEHIKAKAGLDIGGTLIGMHLKEVAVPLRLSRNRIGQAQILCARTRPKFIGGERAFYNDSLK